MTVVHKRFFQKHLQLYFEKVTVFSGRAEHRTQNSGIWSRFGHVTHKALTQFSYDCVTLVTHGITMSLVSVLRSNVHSIGLAKGLNNTVISRSLLRTGLSLLTTQ